MTPPSRVAAAPPPPSVVHVEAVRSVARRVWLAGHVLAWVSCMTLLAVLTGPFTTLVVGLSWGILVLAHGFVLVLAPELKRRWLGAELERQMGPRVAQERRALAGEHAHSLEELAASIAHEIRNPITAAKSLVQQIEADPAAAENAEYARVAREELDRVERSVSHLLRYAREAEPRHEPTTLAELADAALHALEPRISRVSVRVERDLAEPAPLSGDREQLRRVVMNLVDNALDAHRDRGTAAAWVRLRTGRSLAGTEVWLTVADNAGGIEAARISEIWRPFHTSKASGTGLGLSIARKVVQAHGGSLEVESRWGEGSEFVATFPALGDLRGPR